MMKLLVLLTCLAAVNGVNYLFTMPKLLYSTRSETMCVTFHGEESEQEMKIFRVVFKTQNRFIDTHEIRTYESTCWNFTAPLPGKYEVMVDGYTADEHYQRFMNQSAQIEVKETRQITVIQCDKPMYKPGQIVRFRLMTIDDAMKPKLGVIPMVYISNPADVRVRQWANVNVTRGLVSFEMQLSSDPTLGKWSITAQVEGAVRPTVQTFTVSEYVLPKYEVTITPPVYFLPTTELIEGKICANYTYGQPVKGSLDMSVCYKSYYYARRQRDCYLATVDINGCYDFSINSSALELNFNRWNYYGKLHIEANVTEEGTGVKIEKTNEGPSMTMTPFTLTLSDDTNGYYKPAFPYKLKLKAARPDGSPAANETIEVKAENWQYNFHQLRTFITDADGMVHFAVVGIPDQVSSVTVNARAPAYEQRTYQYRPMALHEPTAYKYAQKWYSPSNSYIDIQPINPRATPCGGAAEFEVFFSSLPGTTSVFSYEVVSQGQRYQMGRVQTTASAGSGNSRRIVDTSQILLPYTPEPRPNYWPRPRPRPIPFFRDGQLTEPETTSTPEPTDGYQQIEEFLSSLESDIIIDSFLLSLPVQAAMSNSASLLVYTVTQDGEIVASTAPLNVQHCFDNQVNLTFEQQQTRPKESVNLKVTATPGSICSVGVVDKSINLLGGDHQVTPEKLYNMFPPDYYYDNTWLQDREYCDSRKEQDLAHLLTTESTEDDSLEEDGSSPEGTTEIPPPKVDEIVRLDMYYADTDTVDSLQAFRSTRMLVFTNLLLQTRPCNWKQYRPVYYRNPRPRQNSVNEESIMQGLPGRRLEDEMPPVAQDEDVAVDHHAPDNAANIRNFFPETWLWELDIVGDDGELYLSKTTPDTITQWVGNAICANADSGVGVSSLVSMTTFQPFFLSFTMPYSAIRGETLPVVVTVFNYLQDCLVMRVTLLPSDGYDLASGDSVVERCVCGGESTAVKYYITPLLLGDIEITAVASNVFDDGTCGNRVVDEQTGSTTDGVRRTILIDPEGVTKEYTYSSYVCLSEQNAEEDRTVSLDLPSEDLVADSARGVFSVCGDVMGPVFNNLQDLLRMPYGCGEQNMASWSPNIVALEYLTATNRLQESVENQALNFMRVGYQRQLKYRHDDGTYSVWGPRSYSESAGSTWLTAFVVKCLGRSRPFIDVDPADLRLSISYFENNQLENGCFRKVGFTHSYSLKGGLDSDSLTGITAFVVIAMMEAGVPKTSQTIARAIQCLDYQQDNDTYTMAMMLYAYTLYDVSHPRRSQVLYELEQRARFKDGMKYWMRSEEKDDKEEDTPFSFWYRAPSAEVEITGYILLSYLYQADHSAISETRPIVMWMSKQRNSLGGFSSTQDTVIGLQALSLYATLVYQNGVNVSLHFEDQYEREVTFDVTDENALVTQQMDIFNFPNALNLGFSGTGCVLVQANVKYNIHEPPTGPDFTGEVSVFRAKNNQNDCKRRSLKVCVGYIGAGGVTNMAVAEIKMITGWAQVESTLDELVADPNLDIKKYEVNDNSVVVYFDKIDANGQCFIFDVEQLIELSDPKPAFVKIYDYYETDSNVVMQYDIKTTCGTKEELPFVDPDIYVCGMYAVMEAPIVQVRLPAARVLNTPLTCPLCMTTSIDVKSAAFKNIVCNATKIYKVTAGRSGDYPFKVKADLRQRRKVVIDKFANFTRNNDCQCEALQSAEDSERKILMFTDETVYDSSEDGKVMTIDDRTTIIPITKNIEKFTRRIVRRKKNGC